MVCCNYFCECFFLLTYVIIKTNLYFCNLLLQPNLFVCCYFTNYYAFDISIIITWVHQWCSHLTYNSTKCEQIRRAQLEMLLHRLHKFHRCPGIRQNKAQNKSSSVLFFSRFVSNTYRSRFVGGPCDTNPNDQE